MEQQKSERQTVDVPPASASPAKSPAEAIPNATVSDAKTAKEKTTDNNKERGKGVLLLTCVDPTVAAIAVAAVVNGIYTEGTVADLPVWPVSVISLVHASGSRDAESVTSYVTKDIQADKLLAKPINHCRRFDPLCPSGVFYMMRQLKPGTCVLAIVDYRDLKRDDAIAALVDLNAAAVERGALVVIYVQHTKKQDVTWLRAYCVAAVEVRKCEPGPGALVSIVLDNLTLVSEHWRGVGRVMIEVFRDADRGWTYQLEPFIAERAVIRLAWHLAHEGMTLRLIQKIVGISASNISRGFQPLLIQPKNAVGLAPPVGWRARWARDYDLDAGSPCTMQEPVVVPSHPPTSVVLSTNRENRKV
ncbi:hypothetical protein [Burkholderia pseudomallei]|uniref:hypothetical protein n=1 Tax=Burkholderia pseudomallei TaxID=28450 RepID=UPI00201B1CE5|nr:hypothetical protein [Burkholderia pseudomallei]MCL4665525.1 hypothetical protein [Burkholderia pseudomallei]